ncbi:MAG: hypothetical protein JXL80_13670 [Planctomycetes bacterium]|nr:hypothetical protein [Planctomycetota bacterium]
MKSTLCVSRVAAAAALLALGLSVAADVSAQELGRRFSFDELKSMVDDAQAVVVAQATGDPVSQGADESGLPWQVPFRVLKVVRGECKDETVLVYVASPISDLGTSRRDVSGSEFVLPLSPLEKLGQGHFRLVQSAGFISGTPEADKLLEVATGKATATGTAETAPVATTSPLRVRIAAVDPPFKSGKPAPIRVTIENAGTEAVMYDSAPLETRDGGLYLSGRGMITVIDSRGNPAAAKDSLHMGEPTEMPLVIRGERDYEKELDLGQYFDLSRAGNYMVQLLVGTPDGKEVLQSNTMNVQIVAPADLPAARPVDEPEGPLAVRIPSPEAYRPGEPANGMAVLLKPVKAEFAVGEPILMEVRLINAGDVPVTVDARLERTLLVAVQEQAGSPAVRQMFQRPSGDDAPKTESYYPYAYLRRLGFWGKVININSWYGRDAASLVEGGDDKSQLTSSYERDGMTLFSFDEPGTYKVQATYSVKPRGGEGPKVWQGKTISNPVFIRVVKSDALVPVEPGP